MDISAFIKKERICLLTDTKKSEVLISLCELAAQTGDEIENLDGLKKDIFFREELMSTGIGLGLAIPHVRIEGLVRPVICVGVQKKGIYDYQSLDNKPVHVVIMILVNADEHRQYIRILSQITGSLKNKELIPCLLAAENTDEIYQILMEI